MVWANSPILASPLSADVKRGKRRTASKLEAHQGVSRRMSSVRKALKQMGRSWAHLLLQFCIGFLLTNKTMLGSKVSGRRFFFSLLTLYLTKRNSDINVCLFCYTSVPTVVPYRYLPPSARTHPLACTRPLEKYATTCTLLRNLPQ